VTQKILQIERAVGIITRCLNNDKIVPSYGFIVTVKFDLAYT
jgi:hypothetical protein